MSVPAGFTVTVSAYCEAVAAAGLQSRITKLLAAPGTDQQISEAIIALFDQVVLPESLAAEIVGAYTTEIGGGPVAVRSSALAEDSSEASFAGQQDTYLWIEGAGAVLDAVVRCWASLFNPQAIGYRRRFAVAPDEVAMAVVVQQMVPAVAAGVTMTLEPVTGDRRQIYVASALGLGEGVVKGDVEADSAWVDKAPLRVRKREISRQTRAYRYDSGEVKLIDLAPGEGDAPSLDDDTLLRVAGLALQIERHAGHAVDVEWAVDVDGEVHLLQARPETVWNNRNAEPPGWRKPNILHHDGGERPTWTTTNAAEAIPGIQTPLGVSLVDHAGEKAFRGAFHAIGALSRAELATPVRPEERIAGFFFGRVAVNLNVLCSWVDRIPGTSGHGLAEQIFAHVPEDYEGHAHYRYYPRVAAKMLTPFIRYPRLVREDRRAIDVFWRDAQRQLIDADEALARQFLVDGREAFTESIVRHIALVMGAVQPAYDILEKLAAQVGLSASTLMSGHGGHEETHVLDDIWECSRDRLSLEEFLLRHGYHGPNEGDVSATVWREDPRPVRELIESYRRKTEAPNADAAERTRRRRAAESEFIARLPRHKRPLGRGAIALAGKYVPMRGIGKVAFLQGTDVVRAAARRLGHLLANAGVLENPDDAFFLTIDELYAGCLANARALVAERRALYEHYRTIDLPTFWRGMPEPATVDFDATIESIDGTGASPGVVEGVVRVVEDPATAHIAEGEILVAGCTDPGWASLMFLSAGLITDIGGIMSHTAVVAREMSIPCVVNTKIATRVLNDGDRVLMDGSTGQVQILERNNGGRA
ncbi:hypothetical protein AWC03_22755 [Mycobacterium europaeum]|nr:hypothetical protein AWC03_22755 [Mycobacterium europaeum]